MFPIPHKHQARSTVVITKVISSLVPSRNSLLVPVSMARKAAPANLKDLISLRICNLPFDKKDDDIIQDFQVFGAIGDYYRPVNMIKKKPSPYAFVRYYKQEDADSAQSCMHGKQYGDNVISVLDANKQNSFFTQDTGIPIEFVTSMKNNYFGSGFITNEAFDFPKVVVDNFDSSMPESHYEKKRRQELLLKNNVFSVRVDDIPLDVTKERLEELFGEYGEISSVYYPQDLKTIRPRGFAFIRYIRESSVRDAVEGMDQTFLGSGRNIVVTAVPTSKPSYFSQDESNAL